MTNNKMIKKKSLIIIIILFIFLPYNIYAFERALEPNWPRTCGDMCTQKNLSKKNGYSKLFYNNHSYSGNFKNFYINGYGELKFDTGDYYKGNFSNKTIDGLGEYHWLNQNHKYLGSFKNDFLSGKGVYISPTWIINAEFEEDKIQKGEYYACNRIDGSIYITEKYGNIDVFSFSPNRVAEDFFPGQRKIIMDTKRKLTKLYYYNGLVNTRCNGNLFSAIIEFYKDENDEVFATNLLSNEFFIKIINSVKFQNKLNSAILRINQ